jgi:lysyl-tRNA synthetase class 2
VGVAAVGFAAVIVAADPADHARGRLLTRVEPAGPPSLGHVLVLLAGLSLLALAPKVLRGMRAALPLAIVALAALSVLHVMRPLGFAAAAVALGLAFALAFGRRVFPLGSRNRPRPALVFAASGAWALAYLAVLAGVGSAHGRDIRLAVHRALGHVLHVPLAPPAVSGTWILVIEVLIGCAAAISLLALRSLLRPAAGHSGHTHEEHEAARFLVERYGEDSLSSFILRPDKSFHFDGDGVLAYTVVGETAVVSGDPVGRDGDCPRVLESFRELARERGWEVVVWGASSRHLAAYRASGMRAVVAGEEAVVDPARFTLEGRAVRKLRQSVHRVARRGWEVQVCEGRALDPALEAEVDALEDAWREQRGRLIGFAMGMGPFEAEPRPDDLYALARSPDGRLGAALRFVSHRGKLSLETMHRVGDTPNGLTEALVCHALAAARERGVVEVSLNYAGLGHLARRRGRATRLLLRVLGRRFQLDRLVRFNEKFSPEWRPRYLVCESAVALPRAIVRVLQAEGYLPQHSPAALWLPRRVRLPARGLRPHAAR